MVIHKITPTSTAFVFDELEDYSTNVFVIEKQEKIYVIDTFCGPKAMVPVLEHLNDSQPQKEIMVINTHFHWDHVWGNCCFMGKSIISHELCRQLLDEQWDEQINKNCKFVMGDVEKCLPNTLLKDKLYYNNDGIEVFYSPGHTIDSISVFDHDEKVLYAGDNLEKPIIYVESRDISSYINTLENYLSLKPRIIVAGHTLDLTDEDVTATIKYLKALASGEHIIFESEYEKGIHNQNLNMLK